MPELPNHLQYKGIEEVKKTISSLPSLLRLNVLNYNKHLKAKISLHNKKNALSSYTLNLFCDIFKGVIKVLVILSVNHSLTQEWS